MRRSHCMERKGLQETIQRYEHDLKVFLGFNGFIACLYLYPEHRVCSTGNSEEIVQPYRSHSNT